jgi:hypothetical protein
MLSSMWFSALASLAIAVLGEDPKRGAPKFADLNTGGDDNSGFAPNEKGFGGEEPLVAPKENALLGAAADDPKAKGLAVDEVDGASNEKVEEGGVGFRFTGAPNPDPKRGATGEGCAFTSLEKLPNIWLLELFTPKAGVLNAPVNVGRVDDPNTEVVIVPYEEAEPVIAPKPVGALLPKAKGGGVIVVVGVGAERAVVAGDKPKRDGGDAADPPGNAGVEELMP